MAPGVDRWTSQCVVRLRAVLCDRCGAEPAREDTTWGDACIRAYLAGYRKKLATLSRYEIIFHKGETGVRMYNTYLKPYHEARKGANDVAR